ncbi:hypothetical protein [uncultured Fibrobacter sp.]|uniref:hypothetical protein n=1 Tax=uncultured Fibrobacter sp. TaxID=261512 RepID=UPI00280650F2|nr:hypothetical protein [uncultured Fibrobacter sp.]
MKEYAIIYKPRYLDVDTESEWYISYTVRRRHLGECLWCVDSKGSRNEMESRLLEKFDDILASLDDAALIMRDRHHCDEVRKSDDGWRVDCSTHICKMLPLKMALEEMSESTPIPRRRRKNIKKNAFDLYCELLDFRSAYPGLFDIIDKFEAIYGLESTISGLDESKHKINRKNQSSLLDAIEDTMNSGMGAYTVLTIHATGRYKRWDDAKDKIATIDRF